MKKSKAPSQINRTSNMEEKGPTHMLLTCLEELLMSEHNPAMNFSKVVANAPILEADQKLQRGWVPGKATEVMNSFFSKSLTNGTSAVGPAKQKNLNMAWRCPLRTIDESNAPPAPQNSSVYAQSSYSNNQSVSNQGLFTTISSSSSDALHSTRRVINVMSRADPLSTNRQNFSREMDYEVVEIGKQTEKNDSALSKSSFKTAYELMLIDDKAKGIKRSIPPTRTNAPPSPVRKMAKLENNTSKKEEEGLSDNPEVNALMADERLKNIEPKMVEAILNEVVELGSSTDWDDIAGLSSVKAIIKEVVIWPIKRPDIFTGLRGPPKGILLFGPPGTGKTMFGRLIATQSDSTFFNISASSLMSKWCGDGEKMVRALFQVARVKQPAVIFIDEIDSILTQRSDSEHESSRRLKTEFLIQFDGCGTNSEDKILVIGVTNRPQELDEAARRRLVKRIYIPLPDENGRQQLVRNLLKDQRVLLMDEDYTKIANLTNGFSGADMTSLCKDAAYGPIRDIGHDIQNIQADNVRPIQIQDFEHSLKTVKSSVAPKDLLVYEDWDKQFGCRA